MSARQPRRGRGGCGRLLGALLLLGFVVAIINALGQSATRGNTPASAPAANVIDTPGPTETAAPTETPAPTATPPPHYSVRLTGTYTAVERVGQLATFRFTVENIGTAIIPNYTLRLRQMDPWAVRSVTSSDCSGTPTEHTVLGTDAWSVGPVYAPGSCTITVQLLPLQSGTYTLEALSFSDANDDAYISDGAGDLAAKTAILPGY